VVSRPGLPRRDQQARDADMIRTWLRVTPAFHSPDERRSGEHAVQRIYRCAMFQKNPHGINAPGHRRAVQRSHLVLVR
jgi:hypothetical protein